MSLAALRLFSRSCCGVLVFCLCLTVFGRHWWASSAEAVLVAFSIFITVQTERPRS